MYYHEVKMCLERNLQYPNSDSPLNYWNFNLWYSLGSSFCSYFLLYLMVLSLSCYYFDEYHYLLMQDYFIYDLPFIMQNSSYSQILCYFTPLKWCSPDLKLLFDPFGLFIFFEYCHYLYYYEFRSPFIGFNFCLFEMLGLLDWMIGSIYLYYSTHCLTYYSSVLLSSCSLEQLFSQIDFQGLKL